MKRRDFLRRGLAAAGTTLVYGLGPDRSRADEAPGHLVVDQVRPDKSGGFYSPNRAPLQPAAFMKLPVGSIAPQGWLLTQLQIQADGLNGRMPEVSDYLDYDKTGWITPANDGWEEVSYWLRGFAPLGYVLGDARIIETSRKWAQGIMATQQEDGWFGPARVKTVLEGGPDMWPHMPILAALARYHEYTGDAAVIPFLTKYFQFQNAQDPKVFGRGWGAFRWGDNIDSIYWLYNQTGESFLLDLVRTIHAHSASYVTGIPTSHNVNLAQGFREPAQYSLVDSDPKYAAATYRVHDTIFSNYGQFPGGGFAGDETCREGFTDPRQGIETCGVVELMQSYEILTRITGDPLWLDRCEQAAFNTLPAALDPLQKGCHYVTSANSTALCDHGAQHAQYDDSPMNLQTYKPGVHDYRCCPHNYGMGWPMFAEHLWLATNDGGLCAALYAASKVTAKVASGLPVTITTVTDYPFREAVALTIAAAQAVQFPLYLRVPGWCTNFIASINGQPVAAQAKPKSFLVLNRLWQPGDVVTLHLPMPPRVKTWTESRNAVSLSRGPLDYSLAIKENWRQTGGSADWPEYNIDAGSPWNYGLVLDPNDPTHSIDVVQKGGPITGNPFTDEGNPLELRVTARKIRQWQNDGEGFTPVLQDSPAQTAEPVETVSLIPMGAARLRISTFPTVTDEPSGLNWNRSPIYVAQVRDSQNRRSQVQALLYDTQPAHSHDIRVPRFWLDDRGREEWVMVHLPNARQLAAAAVYWFQDTGLAGGWYRASGAFRLPASWRIEYRDQGEWKPVQPKGDCGLALDQSNRVEFEPVVARTIRMIVKPNHAPVGFFRLDLFDPTQMLVPTITDQAVAALQDTSLAGPPLSVYAASFQANKIVDAAGGDIKSWTDFSDLANDAVSIGATPPTFVPSALNGLPVLRFDASRHQYLAFERPVQDDFTIAVVFRSTQGVSDGTNYFGCAGLVQGEVAGVADDFGLSLSAKGQVAAGTGNPDTSIASPPGFNDGKPHLAVFERVKSTGSIRLFVDGKKVAEGTAGTQSLTAPAQLGIGAQPNGANCYSGDIAEVALYAQAFPDELREKLESGLMTKWGLAKV